MGRSRGGLSTKIHALVDAMGLPIALKLTEGQAHDGRSAVDMFETVRAGNILLADRAYDSNALRKRLAERGAWETCRTVSIPRPSAGGLTSSAMPLSVSSINSSSSALLPHATTRKTTTISLPLSSLHCEYGFDLLSR